MTDHALSADPSSKSGKLTGWHVFWIMLGFFATPITSRFAIAAGHV